MQLNSEFRLPGWILLEMELCVELCRFIYKLQFNRIGSVVFFFMVYADNRADGLLDGKQ